MKNHAKKILITRFDMVKRFSYATSISINFYSLIINKINRYIETLEQVMDIWIFDFFKVWLIWSFYCLKQTCTKNYKEFGKYDGDLPLKKL